MVLASWRAKSGARGVHVVVRIQDRDVAAKRHWMALSNSLLNGMVIMKTNDADVVRYAQMLSAMGTQPRLRIMRLLVSAHPDGMIVMDIQAELGIPGSTLSHHLEKLKIVDLVRVHREHTCLRYSANTEFLQELVAFLFEECCSKSRTLKAKKTVSKCG